MIIFILNGIFIIENGGGIFLYPYTSFSLINTYGYNIDDFDWKLN